MTLSLSIAGLHAHGAAGPWNAGVRAAIGWVGEVGFRSVHLDAASPEIRPRGLDRSARRDLAATIRRAGIGLTGLDLWIPAAHYDAPESADRAHAAVTDAVGLAADLAVLCGRTGAVVSVTLPPDYAGLETIGAHAESVGVFVEDFSISASGTPDEMATHPQAVRPGFDTARAILRGDGPGKAFAKWSKKLASLRLNDADDTGRRMIGSGTLDAHMLGALHTTLTPSLPMITDLRGLENPERAARAAIAELGADGPGLPGIE